MLGIVTRVEEHGMAVADEQATGTALARRSTFDLTQDPSDRWNDEMVKMVAGLILRRATKQEQYYCLAVAESLGLNPLIDEIYFLPGKAKDGEPAFLKPYIGRNGLVAKAQEVHHSYQTDVVHENDRFRITKKRDGVVEVTHSYSQKDRGEIVGAYAVLTDDAGVKPPAVAYAKLSEYLPTFDADWKMSKSPWGNQTSAMICKCAMILAGRGRLRLGNLMVDGEIARFEQQQAVGPGAATAPASGEFDWSALSCSPDTRAALAGAVGRINARSPEAWTAAKLEMVLSNRTADELEAFAGRLIAEAEHLEMLAAAESAPEAAEDVGEAADPESSAATGSAGETPVDGDVVPEPVDNSEAIAIMGKRIAGLEDRIAIVDPSSEEAEQLSNELDALTSELDALENPEQGRLL